MRRSRRKKKIKAISMLFLTCGMLLLSLTSNYIFKSEDDMLSNDEGGDYDKQTLLFEDSLNTADYSSSYQTGGALINLALHQSYVNNSFDTLVIPSDSNNDNFSLPSPTDLNFNSSFINITIDNVKANNYTYVVESNTTISSAFDLTLNEYASSFTVNANSYLKNISVQLAVFGAAAIDVYLYNSTWTGSRNEPDTNLATLGSLGAPVIGWNKLTLGTPRFLDKTKTTNNTWYIACWDSIGINNAQWRYHVDDAYNIDNSISYSGWWNPQAVDFYCDLDLVPIDQIPDPTDIGLRINKTSVTYYGVNGSAYWENSSVFSNTSGLLEFEVTTDWFDVECNITKVQINYTKTDLIATSDLTISGSGQNILWNVTRSGGLNYFDSRINDYNVINFTIPTTWGSVEVWNGGTDKTGDATSRDLNNGYKDISVINAGNGAYWFLNATSSNLLNSINTYVSSIDSDLIYYSEVIELNATLTEIIQDGTINLTVYTPNQNYFNYTNQYSISNPVIEVNFGNWDISDNVTEYGDFLVHVYWNNLTAAGLLEKTITLAGITEVSLVSPPDMDWYYSNRLFNVTIFYNDTLRTPPISGAQITDNSTGIGPFYSNGTAGYYTAELNTSDYNYGWNYIEINASKQFYENKSLVFSFEVRVNTTISPSNAPPALPTIIRGDNTSYTFNYSDIFGKSIDQASWARVSPDEGFIAYLKNKGNGNYTIILNSSNVNVGGYNYVFNISSLGNETQVINLTINVILIQTDTIVKFFNATRVRKDGLNQTIRLYFNDTDNGLPITGLTTTGITVTQNQTGGTLTKEITPYGSDGNYILNVSLSGLDSGWIQLELNVSLLPNYNWSLAYLDFYLIGNSSQINIISINYTNQVEINATGVGNVYDCYEDNDIVIDFYVNDTDDLNKVVKGLADSYFVFWYNQTNPMINGTLSYAFTDNALAIAFGIHRGMLFSSALPSIGNYTVNITISKTNYEKTTLSFNLTIIGRINVTISPVTVPSEVTAGGTLTITVKVEYEFNSSTSYPLVGITLSATLYVNGINSTSIDKVSGADGKVTFSITIPDTANTVKIVITTESLFNITAEPYEITSIKVIPALGFIITILILAAVGIGAVASIYGIYRGVVVPKKREKKRILTEVKTVFDDAINLEHLLVLYKGTGTCIFFKSFGTEEIDPELISGFLTAVSSFGREMESQQALNEITYGDKMLLLADGGYIRVALVLGKQGSVFLRKHLKNYIDSFEEHFTNELPKWRGQIDVFQTADHLIDESLNTSIILPHEITYEYSTVKALKNPNSRVVLKVANSLMEDTERNFFFVATLLKETTDATGKDSAEIFMGIKELRDKQILIPIEISSLETQPVSAQELNLIYQRVAELPNLAEAEKEALVNNLAQMGPAEREAYIASLTEHQEIVTAPIKEKGAGIIENAKGAKKEITKLMKVAKSAKKGKEFEKAVEYFNSAANIAMNWDLTKQFEDIQDISRLTSIENLRIKLVAFENDAKRAAKSSNFVDAAGYYKQAAEMANEIFKLGVTEMTKDLKRLTNKAKEFEKLLF